MRGDRPFAYDLVIEYGAVSSRVALLLRSAEAKPRFFTSVLESKLPISGFPPFLKGSRLAKGTEPLNNAKFD
jgi:hypothetical protein